MSGLIVARAYIRNDVLFLLPKQLLPYKLKHVLNRLAADGRSLQVLARPDLFRLFLAHLLRHCPICIQIAFVAHQNEEKVFCVVGAHLLGPVLSAFEALLVHHLFMPNQTI